MYMADQNPYQSPEAAELDIPDISDALFAVAQGQKLIIYAILINFLGMAVAQVSPVLLLVVNIIALLLSIVGIVKLASGLEFSLLTKILTISSMIVPLINLLVLAALSAKATKMLKQGGYKVGLLGAKM